MAQPNWDGWVGWRWWQTTWNDWFQNGAQWRQRPAGNWQAGNDTNTAGTDYRAGRRATEAANRGTGWEEEDGFWVMAHDADAAAAAKVTQDVLVYPDEAGAVAAPEETEDPSVSSAHVVRSAVAEEALAEFKQDAHAARSAAAENPQEEAGQSFDGSLLNGAHDRFEHLPQQISNNALTSLPATSSAHEPESDALSSSEPMRFTQTDGFIQEGEAAVAVATTAAVANQVAAPPPQRSSRRVSFQNLENAASHILEHVASQILEEHAASQIPEENVALQITVPDSRRPSSIGVPAVGQTLYASVVLFFELHSSRRRFLKLFFDIWQDWRNEVVKTKLREERDALVAAQAAAVTQAAEAAHSAVAEETNSSQLLGELLSKFKQTIAVAGPPPPTQASPPDAGSPTQ